MTHRCNAIRSLFPAFSVEERLRGPVLASALGCAIMATNIEVKARAREPEKLRRIAAELAGTAGELILQEDVFFEAPYARLKLRLFSSVLGELIAYRREDRAGVKASRYVIAPTTEPSAREALAIAL